MLAATPRAEDFSDSWVEDEPALRWRSTVGHEAASSGSSILIVAPGCRLDDHTDSAEETVVVVRGRAEVTVGGERGTVGAGGVAVIPADELHAVANAGDEELEFVAVYAAGEVVTRYAHPVQPEGEPERKTIG